MAMANHAEMITMYHPDGDGLALTHYCMLGNQPRMKASKDQKPGSSQRRPFHSVKAEIAVSILRTAALLERHFAQVVARTGLTT